MVDGARRLGLTRAVGWALLAGAVLRGWFLWRFAHVMGDSLVYGDIAKNLLLHGVYGFSRMVNGVAIAPRPTLIRLPGYPLFLAAIFKVFGVDRYEAVMPIQLLMDLWTCLLVGGTAARMWGRRAGLGALWLAVVCPFTANYVSAPLTETPTLFCIALAFYALVRWREEGAGLNRWVLAIAFALSWAILLRPEQGMLAAAIVPAMLWLSWRDGGLWARVRAGVAVSVLALLPLVPWTARNWHTFHVFEPLAPRWANDPGEASPHGFQRWYRTWAVEFASTVDIYWNYDGSPISIGDLPNRAFDSNAEYEATERLFADYNQNQASTPAFDDRFAELARQRVAADPLRYYVWMPWGRVLNMAFRPRTENLPVLVDWWQFRVRPWQSAFSLGYALLNLGYFVLAGLGLRRWRVLSGDGRVVVWAMLGTIVFRVALMLTIDNSEPRYTLEFFPVLMVFGGVVLTRRQQGEREAIAIS